MASSFHREDARAKFGGPSQERAKMPEELKAIFSSAAHAFKEKAYRKAVDSFQNALDIVFKMDKQEQEDWSETVILTKYLICMSWLETNESSNLLTAEKILEDSTAEANVDIYPMLYYALAKTYFKLFRLKKTTETLKLALSMLNKQVYVAVHCVPGTDIVIFESRREYLQAKLLSLSEQCSGYCLPDAVCCLDDCSNYSKSEGGEDKNIYFRNPAFIGLVNVICDYASNPCNMKFHISCWKAKKDSFLSIGKKSNKDVIGWPCFTPKCETLGIRSIIRKIEVFDEHNCIKSTIVSRGDEATGRPHKVSAAKSNKDQPVKKQQTPRRPPSNSKTMQGEARAPVQLQRRLALVYPPEGHKANNEPDEGGEGINGVHRIKEAIEKLKNMRDTMSWNIDLAFRPLSIMLDRELRRGTPLDDDKLSWIFSCLYEYINSEGPVKFQDLDVKWNEVKDMIKDCDPTSDNNPNIREILMESPKLAALNSDICSTEQLCQLYKNVKREMSDVLKFLIDNNEDDVGSQAGSFDDEAAFESMIEQQLVYLDTAEDNKIEADSINYDHNCEEILQKETPLDKNTTDVPIVENSKIVESSEASTSSEEPNSSSSERTYLKIVRPIEKPAVDNSFAYPLTVRRVGAKDNELSESIVTKGARNIQKDEPAFDSEHSNVEKFENSMSDIGGTRDSPLAMRHEPLAIQDDKRAVEIMIISPEKEKDLFVNDFSEESMINQLAISKKHTHQLELELAKRNKENTEMAIKLVEERVKYQYMEQRHMILAKIDESAKNSAAVATIDESFKSHLGHGLPNVPLLMGSYHRATYQWNNMYKKLKERYREIKDLLMMAKQTGRLDGEFNIEARAFPDTPQIDLRYLITTAFAVNRSQQPGKFYQHPMMIIPPPNETTLSPPTITMQQTYANNQPIYRGAPGYCQPLQNSYFPNVRAAAAATPPNFSSYYPGRENDQQQIQISNKFNMYYSHGQQPNSICVEPSRRTPTHSPSRSSQSDRTSTSTTSTATIDQSLELEDCHGSGYASPRRAMLEREFPVNEHNKEEPGLSNVVIPHNGEMTIEKLRFVTNMKTQESPMKCVSPPMQAIQMEKQPTELGNYRPQRQIKRKNKSSIDIVMSTLRSELSGVYNVDMLKAIEFIRQCHGGHLTGLAMKQVILEAGNLALQFQNTNLAFYDDKSLQNTSIRAIYENRQTLLSSVKSIEREKSTGTKKAWGIIHAPNETWIGDVSDDNCAICHDPMKEQVSMYTLNCKHKFHKDCIKDWCAREQSCPNCRAHAIVDDAYPPLPAGH